MQCIFSMELTSIQMIGSQDCKDKIGGLDCKDMSPCLTQPQCIILTYEYVHNAEMNTISGVSEFMVNVILLYMYVF